MTPSDFTESELMAALAALGAKKPQTDDERVFAFYVERWRELGWPGPKHTDVARTLGLPETSLNNSLRRLQKDGRMLHPERGVWVPVVAERAA